MKTNITIDNYEAYLLDYLEGNLGKDETAQLKAFVAAQGLDWEELTQPLPYLEAPSIVYENKENLGRPFDKLRDLESTSQVEASKGRTKGTIVPLYVKIASAAAAAGLLLTVTLWPKKQHPYVEPVAELKPILAERLITTKDPIVLSKRSVFHIPTQIDVEEEQVTHERIEMPLLTTLEPKKAKSLSTPQSFNEPDLGLLAYHINSDLAFTQIGAYRFDDYEDRESETSLIGKGLLWMTSGRYSNFASLINAALGRAKQKATEAATDFALTAYQRAEEQFEETRDRWEEKRNE